MPSFTLKYTKYFESRRQAEGLPDLVPAVMEKYLHIMMLESEIKGVNTIRLQDPELSRRFVMEFFSLDQELWHLTRNIPPEDLYNELIHASEHYHQYTWEVEKP